MGFGSGCRARFVTPRVGALGSTVRLLKPGAPFLLYLYYRFDNRSLWFRTLGRASGIFRDAISRMPDTPKRYATGLIAPLVYWPRSRIAWLYAAMGLPVGRSPCPTATPASTCCEPTAATGSARRWSGDSRAMRSAR